MPDVTLYHKLATTTQRWPALHRPLRTSRKFFTEKIPGAFVDVLRAVAPRGNFHIGPPKNSFSILESLAFENSQARRIVLTGQGLPNLGPDSLMVHCGMHQHEWQPMPIFWSHQKKSRLVSTSLALMDGKKRICRESVYGDFCVEDDPAWNYCHLPKEIFLEGNWTSLVSRWCPNGGVPTFSHWIMDALPRLALLKEFPADTKILVPSKLAGYQKETLKMLGLLDRVRYTPERHLVLENYFFSSPTSMISCYNPYAIRWLRETFSPHADKSYNGPKRFIIQRKGKTRGIKNETEVNDFFQKLGWKIIDTETLTFAQELQLFSNAEAVAGIFGSGFTNCIWSPPGCKVITFIPDSFVDGGVESHCIVNKIDYHWQIFPSDHAMMATVDIGEIKKLLRKAGLEAG